VKSMYNEQKTKIEKAVKVLADLDGVSLPFNLHATIRNLEASLKVFLENERDDEEDV